MACNCQCCCECRPCDETGFLSGGRVLEVNGHSFMIDYPWLTPPTEEVQCPGSIWPASFSTNSGESSVFAAVFQGCAFLCWADGYGTWNYSPDGDYAVQIHCEYDEVAGRLIGWTAEISATCWMCYPPISSEDYSNGPWGPPGDQLADYPHSCFTTTRWSARFNIDEDCLPYGAPFDVVTLGETNFCGVKACEPPFPSVYIHSNPLP